MSQTVVMAEGRRPDLVSKVARRAAQLIRTKTLRPRAPAALVSFTFDDIPDTAAEAGAACLEEVDARGTFYVAGELCGRRFGDWTFASGAAVGALHARGHEIGCHTFSHPDMQRLGRQQLADDLDRNAAAIQGFASGIRLANFAYPYGSFALPQKLAVQRRFRSARGTREGINGPAIDLGQLLAVRLYDHLVDPGRLDGLMRETVATKGWLIFYTHDVAAKPSPHGCTPGLLQAAIHAARSHHCPIVTVDAALDRLAA